MRAGRDAVEAHVRRLNAEAALRLAELPEESDERRRIIETLEILNWVCNPKPDGQTN